MDEIAIQRLLGDLRALQSAQRAVIESSRASNPAALAQVAKDEGGDIIYAIDADVEEILVEYCREWAKSDRFILIAEGLSQAGRLAFPEDTTDENAAFYLIVDPIDGTRPLMYDKRSAWSLAAIVPNPPEAGQPPRLRDAVVA